MLCLLSAYMLACVNAVFFFLLHFLSTIHIQFPLRVICVVAHIQMKIALTSISEQESESEKEKASKERIDSSNDNGLHTKMFILNQYARRVIGRETSSHIGKLLKTNICVGNELSATSDKNKRVKHTIFLMRLTSNDDKMLNYMSSGDMCASTLPITQCLFFPSFFQSLEMRRINGNQKKREAKNPKSKKKKVKKQHFNGHNKKWHARVPNKSGKWKKHIHNRNYHFFFGHMFVCVSNIHEWVNKYDFCILFDISKCASSTHHINI